MPVDLFSLDPTSNPCIRAASKAARPFLSRLLGLGELQRLYTSLPPGPDLTFPDRVLDALSIRVSSDPDALARIPSSGPVIVAATHPRGALDGLALASLVRRVRRDAWLIANYWLARIPELRSSSFFVDPFDRPEARWRSLAGLRAAHLCLRRGGAVIIFPAGEVAHEHDADGMLIEREWPAAVGRLAVTTGARVVSASISGANSSLFYRAGRIPAALRTAMLGHELLRARGERVSVAFAPPFTARGDAREVTLRAQREATRLASRRAPARGPLGSDVRLSHAPAGTDVSREVAALPADHCLIDAGQFRVFCAPAVTIPSALQEIGRLRSIAYRAAGEGSGTDCDLDRFDQHYLHLFAWDTDHRRIVGAYRIGRTDRILRTHGVDGLYTRSLFRYGMELIDRLSPALELGRSFVRPEYQRHHQALLLLWRGIGEFVVRHPEYRMLFGPVSISATYCDASHGLLTSFLEHNHLDASLAAMVTPNHPRPASTVPVLEVPRTVDAADRLVSLLEGDGKGMPVLLRQYLKLNARALGFSLDPNFGSVVDALMAVDLSQVDRKILRRYLGRDAVHGYLARHAAAMVPAPSRYEA